MAHRQAQRSNKPQEPQRTIINDPELIKKFLDVEQQKIASNIKRQELESKSIESNERLAVLSIEKQSEYLNQKPKEDRKDLILLGIIITALLLIALVFMGWLFYMKKDDFANNILSTIKYVLVAGGGYAAGIKKKPKDQLGPGSASDIQEAEVIQ